MTERTDYLCGISAGSFNRFALSTNYSMCESRVTVFRISVNGAGITLSTHHLTHHTHAQTHTHTHTHTHTQPPYKSASTPGRVQ